MRYLAKNKIQKVFIIHYVTSFIKGWHCPCANTYSKHNSRRSTQTTITQGGTKVNKKGFPLIEVLIGLIILAIGLLSIAGMQITSVKGNFFSHYLTQASYVGQDRLEFLNHLPIDDAQLQPGNYNDGTVTISGIVFNRAYTVAINGDFRKRDWNLCLRDQLLWRFVHAYNRIDWIDRTLVNVQHHFHIRNKAAVLLRWNYPPLVLPRFDFVFFKTRRTAS